MCQEGTQVSLYRDDYIIWTKEMPFSRLKVLGVSNSGSISLLSEEGLYIYPQAPESNPEFIQRYSRDALKQKSAVMGKIIVNDEGDRFLIECTMPRRSGIGTFLGTKAKDAPKYVVVNLMDLGRRRHAVFYESPIPREQGPKLLWNASRMFSFFAVAEPRGAASYVVSVIHMETEEMHKEFEIKSPQISRVEVNEQGTAMIEITEQDGKRIEIYSVAGDRYSLSVPTEYEALHLGRCIVAFRTQPVPSLMIKTFEDNLICQASLRALDELRVPYRILFESRDQIDFLYLLDKNLKVVKSEIEHFMIEAKRWQRLAEEVKEKPDKEILLAHEEEEKKARQDDFHKKKHEELSNHLKVRIDEKKSLKVLSRDEQERELEELRLQYVLGNICEDDYLLKKEELEGPQEPPRESPPPAAEAAAGKAAPAQIPAKPPARPRLEIGGGETKKSADKAQVPAGKSKALSDDETRKIEKLISTLEERFIMGQISEESYKELKEKYEKKLME